MAPQTAVEVQVQLSTMQVTRPTEDDIRPAWPGLAWL